MWNKNVKKEYKRSKRLLYVIWTILFIWRLDMQLPQMRAS